MTADVLTWGNQTIADLEKVEGKAELIAGRIVRSMAGAYGHGIAAFQVTRKLYDYQKLTGVGAATPDGVGFAVPVPLSSGRQSFSPDAAYASSQPSRRGIVDGAPVFAVEVRSEEDYGPVAETRLSEKRTDYFEAGTIAIWDVDWIRGETVAVYRSSDPENPTVYSRGDIADAEPALPGWRMPVDDVFAL